LTPSGSFLPGIPKRALAGDNTDYLVDLLFAIGTRQMNLAVAILNVPRRARRMLASAA
jgi:hypothetical protein